MTDSAEDGCECHLLDQYLAQLQAGERPDRDALLREHPELGSALNCLEALEVLAPPREKMGTGTSPKAGPSHPESEGSEPVPIFSDDAAPAVGELPRDFGPYELIREIGRGGMGVVYEARQKGLDRSVAVKMILASHLASPELVRRFQAEAKAAARLRHSNIVHIHDVGQFHGQDFFAMEYIDGPKPRRADRPGAGRRADGRAAGGHRGPGGRASAPAGDRPPRPEAVEHPARRRRPALRDRLRAGEGFRRPAPT